MGEGYFKLYYYKDLKCLELVMRVYLNELRVL